MKIRRAKIQDAKAIHEAHMRSIQELCAKDYTEKEIQAWGHRPYQEEQRKKHIKEDYIWVVVDHGKIEGFSQLKIMGKEGKKVGFINAFYLTSKVAGQGMGRKLHNLMIETCKKLSIKIVELESTKTSHEFYFKMGFKDTGPIKTHEVQGVPIPCYPMKLDL